MPPDLEHADAVSLLGQTMRTNAAAKPRPNDDEVEVIILASHGRVHYALEILRGTTVTPLRFGLSSHSE